MIRYKPKLNGALEKYEFSRKFPIMIESIVDKTNFKPNVNDARNLLTSDKIGTAITGLYDFENGVDNGTNHFYIRNRPDITEIDEMIENQMTKANQNIKDAVEKGEKELEKQVLKQKAKVESAKSEGKSE